MKTYRKFKSKLLRDKNIREEYEKLGPEFAVIGMMITRRLEKGVTQKALAKKIKTKQSAISRFEAGQINPTISFLQKVAEALDARLEVSLKKMK